MEEGEGTYEGVWGERDGNTERRVEVSREKTMRKDVLAEMIEWLTGTGEEKKREKRSEV